MKTIIAAICLFAVSALAIDVVVQTNVTVRVATVRVTGATISPTSNGTVSVSAPWQWLDASNRVIQSGTAIYQDADLAAVFGQAWAGQRSAALALCGGRTLRLSVSESNIVAQVYRTVTLPDGSRITGMAIYDAAALTASGLNVAELAQIIAAQARDLTTP